MRPCAPLAPLDQNKRVETVLACAMTAAKHPGTRADTTPRSSPKAVAPSSPPSSLDGTKLDGTKASADLYCGNLGTRATADELCSLLSTIGEVECCQVVVTRNVFVLVLLCALEARRMLVVLLAAANRACVVPAELTITSRYVPVIICILIFQIIFHMLLSLSFLKAVFCGLAEESSQVAQSVFADLLVDPISS